MSKKHEDTTSSDINIPQDIDDREKTAWEVRDRLFRKRKKQNKKLHLNIREAKMAAKTQVRFSHPSRTTIGHQWDLIYTKWINNDGEWTLGNIEGTEGKWTFDVWSNKDDQLLSADALFQHTVSGVTVTDVSGGGMKVTEAQVEEFSTMIDAHLKGGDPEAIVNRYVDNAIKKIETPEWQFAVKVNRELFSDATNVLGRNNFDPLTSWNRDASSFIAFRRRVGGGETGHFDEADISKTLKRAGIEHEIIFPEDDNSTIKNRNVS